MRKSKCKSFMLRHISFISFGSIFTTSVFLNYGKRATVDWVLHDLVKKGFLVRLTPGVFMRNFARLIYPSPLEVAMVKAARFGKNIRAHGIDTAAKFKLLTSGNTEPTFFVDGSTSKFLYQGQYVHLKKASKKTMFLADTAAGKSIRAMQSIGQKNLSDKQFNLLAPLWDIPSEKQIIFKNKAWIPAWIGDRFPPNRYYGPFGPGKSNAMLQHFSGPSSRP